MVVFRKSVFCDRAQSDGRRRIHGALTGRGSEPGAKSNELREDGRWELEDGNTATIRASLAAQLEPANLIWIPATAMPPSPTAAAQRLTEPERTSPAAKIPGRLVSSGLG